MISTLHFKHSLKQKRNITDTKETWPNLKLSPMQITNNMYDEVSSRSYETLLLNLLPDYLKWFRQILNKLIDMV